MWTDSKDCLEICKEYITCISLYPSFGNDPFYHYNICFPSCRIGPCLFQCRIKPHSPNNVTCKKLVFREMKQLRKLHLSDPALLLNAATAVPREAATTGSLLVENLQVKYPVNSRTPRLIWEKIRAHLFLLYLQMFTKGRPRSYTCFTSSWYWVSIKEHQNIPKEARRTEMLRWWWRDTMVSFAFICSSNYGSSSWVSVCYIHLTCWKVTWREQALNAFTHSQLLGKTFPWNPHVQCIHLTWSLAFWKENSQPGIRSEKTERKIPIDTLN